MKVGMCTLLSSMLVQQFPNLLPESGGGGEVKGNNLYLDPGSQRGFRSQSRVPKYLLGCYIFPNLTWTCCRCRMLDVQRQLLPQVICIGPRNAFMALLNC